MPSIDKAYKWAITWCNKAKVGYSQTYRNKQTVRGITYFDCSSFINYALIAGGFKTPDYAPNHNAFTTVTMGNALISLGFKQYSTSSSFVWKAGDIGVDAGAHTEMCYKGGTGKAIFMGAHTSHVVLANQVSIGSSNGNASYTRTFNTCYRYKEDGAKDDGFSMYVVAAMCGNFWQESGVNPGVWQNLDEPATETTAEKAWDSTKVYRKDNKVSYRGHNYTCKKTTTAGTRPTNNEYWSDNGAFKVYDKWKSLSHGFGLGQWTNTGEDRNGRLYKLHEYSQSHGGDGSMEAQVSYITYENTWHKSTSYQQSIPYDSLSQFLQSTSEDLDELTKSWYYCWEGVDDGTLSKRQSYAQQVLDYFQEHEGDDSTDYVSANSYITVEQTLQNCLAILNLLGGVIIKGGTKRRKVRKMPVWMMIRYHY